MPRPMKVRKVSQLPKCDHFESSIECNETIVLKVEEIEAMRLKDIEGLQQQDCADKMGVSRQTFQLIIEEARKKVTRALVNGLNIQISGGNFITKECHFSCSQCDEEYIPKFRKDRAVCPSCGADASCKTKKHKYCHKRKNL